jgi:hypothetical protein
MKKYFLLLTVIILLFGIKTSKAQELMVKRTNNKENFILFGKSFDNNHNAYTAMFGTLKKIGVYGKFKTDLNFKEDNQEILEEIGSVNKIFWKGNMSKGRLSGTIGGLLRVNNNIFPYLGLGYGKSWIIWETTGNSNVKIADYSYSGIEYETGIITKINRFMLSGGISLNSLSHLEINVGVGISF